MKRARAAPEHSYAQIRGGAAFVALTALCPGVYRRCVRDGADWRAVREQRARSSESCTSAVASEVAELKDREDAEPPRAAGTTARYSATRVEDSVPGIPR